MKRALHCLLFIAVFLAKVQANEMLSPSSIHYFKGEINQGKVLLQWTTDPTNSCSFYAVERSSDGYTYEQIGLVFENSHAPKTYTLQDAPPKGGLYYYRLKTVGGMANENNEVISVQYKEPELNFNVFPNPAKEILHLNYTVKENEKVVFGIFDLSGNILRSYDLCSLDNHFCIENTDLDRGVYFFSFTKNETVVYQGRLVVTE